MSKRNKILASILIILVVVALVANFLLPKDESPTEIPQPSSTPRVYPRYRTGETPFPVPQSDTVRSSGVTIRNVVKESVSINPRGDALVSEASSFHTIYFSKEDQFLISITEIPFEEKRKIAEQDFIRLLEITEAEACKLNVVITTPAFVNPDESGKNYSLSFCENSQIE